MLLCTSVIVTAFFSVALSHPTPPSSSPSLLHLFISAHPIAWLYLSCHCASHLSQQPGSPAAYLPHLKGKQAFREVGFQAISRFQTALGLLRNELPLLNGCFPCLMMPGCISQSLSPGKPLPLQRNVSQSPSMIK